MDRLEQMIEAGATFTDLVEVALAEGPRWDKAKGRFKRNWKTAAAVGGLALAGAAGSALAHKAGLQQGIQQGDLQGYSRGITQGKQMAFPAGFRAGRGRGRE